MLKQSGSEAIKFFQTSVPYVLISKCNVRAHAHKQEVGHGQSEDVLILVIFCGFKGPPLLLVGTGLVRTT